MRKTNIKICAQFLLLAATVLTFTSCEGIGSQLKGTWKGSMPTSTDEDGTKEDQDVYFEFTPNDDFMSSKGDYIELRDGQFKTTDDDVPVSAHYTYYLKGEWEVDDDHDLHLKPDPSTIKIKLNTEDIKFKIDNEWVSLEDFKEFLRATGLSEKEFINELREDMRKDLKEDYEEDRKTAYTNVFKNIKVDESSMSFETEDVGTLRFKKISKDILEIFSSTSGKAFSEDEDEDSLATDDESSDNESSDDASYVDADSTTEPYDEYADSVAY